MTQTSEKLRSVFLVALMVFSIFGATVAFSGGAAAANAPTGLQYSQSGTASISLVEGQSTTSDVTFDVSGLNNNQSGQTVNFVVSAEDGVEFSSLNSVNSNISVSSSGQVNSDGDIVFSLSPSTTNASDTITIDGAVFEAPSVNGDTDFNLSIAINDTGGADASQLFQNSITVIDEANANETGFLSGRVSDQNNNDIGNATVTAVRTDGLTAETQTNSNGEYTLEVPAGTYNITVTRTGFTTAQSLSNQVEPNRTTTANLVIRRVINADDIQVVASDPVAVADGTDEVSYTVEVTTNDTNSSSPEPIEGVDVTATGDAAVNYSSATTQATNSSGQVTFTATSNQTGEFNVTFTDQAGNNVTTTATFRPEAGDARLQGDVVDNESNVVEGATVWVAYPGENQTLAYAEENQPYLVSDVNNLGKYTIEGIVAGDVNVYAMASGYNRINATSSVGSYVAANETETVYANETENHDLTLLPGGPPQEYRLDVTVNDQKRIEVPAGTAVTATVTVEQRQKGSSLEYTPAANQEIQIETTDVGPLDPDVVNVTTDANGEAQVTFDTPNSGDTNITASTENSLGDVYNTTGGEQANVSVFAPAELTGDVVNEDDEELARGQATVELYIRNTTSGNFESTGRVSEIGSSGSYVFTNLRSGEQYRVIATTETGLTGQATTVSSIPAGTTTNDIVVVGAEPSPANFEVSALSPQNVTVTQGDNITVTANVTNTGIAEGTQTVEFRVGGTAVASQSISLNGSESTTVTFENVSTAGLSAGTYTHGVYTQDDSQTATLTVESDEQSVVEQFDSNNDGDISPGEAQDAIVALNNGEISPSEAQQIIVALNS